MSIPEVDVEALASELASGAAVVDVRNPYEFEELRVPGTVLIPLAELPDRLDELATDRPVYLICRTGARSGRAAQWLRQQGVDAVNVAGGTVAWAAAGHPTESGPQA